MSGAVEMKLDPQAQAEKRTAEMWAEDTASKAMGMERGAAPAQVLGHCCHWQS